MIRYLFWATVAGAVIAAPALWRANATTLNEPVNVCAALRDHISLANIESALEATGLSPTAAGGWAGLVVRTQCPDMTAYVMGQLA